MADTMPTRCSVQGNGHGGFFGMDPQVPEGRPDRRDLKNYQYDDLQNVILRIHTLKNTIDGTILTQSESKTYAQLDESFDAFSLKFGSEGAGVDLALYGPLHDFLSLLESGDFAQADKIYRGICRDSKIFRKFSNFLSSIKFIMKRLKAQSQATNIPPQDQQFPDMSPPEQGQRNSGRARARPRPRTRAPPRRQMRR